MATTKCSVSSRTDLSFNKSNHRSSIIAVTAADSCERETGGVLSKVEQVAGNQPGYVLSVISKLTRENADVLCDYILAEQTAFNISESTKESKITRLAWLALHCKNKPYREMTTADIQSYLDSGRKSDENDPLHKWIGYYNTKIKIFTKFFRWRSLKSWGCSLFALWLSGLSDGGGSLTPSCPPEIGCLVVMPVVVALVLEAAAAAVVAAEVVVVIVV
jgi:hypothetical protein